MDEVKPLSDEVKGRLPRIVLDFVAIIVTLFVAYIVLPVTHVINFNVPVIGLSVGLAVAIVFVVILAVLVVRILSDTTILIHHGSQILAKAVPGLEEHHENLIRKVVRDFFSVVVILILFYLIAPFIVLIPGVGASLAAAIPIILTAIVVIFLYDAARLLYNEVSKEVHKATAKIASMVEESDRKMGEEWPKSRHT